MLKKKKKHFSHTHTDTRGMTPDILQDTMKEYGETGDVKTSCSDDMITKATRLPEKKEKNSTTSVSGLESELLDRLMNEADPELGSSTVEKVVRGGFGTKSFMDDLTRVLGTSSDPSLRAVRDSVVEQQQQQSRSRKKKKSFDENDNTVLAMGMQKMLLKEPKCTIENNRSHVVLVLHVSEMENMFEAELDISETSIRFRSTKYRIDTPIPQNAKSSSAKAKFSKRRKQLRIKFTKRK